MKKIIFGMGILIVATVLLQGCVTGGVSYEPSCKCQLVTRTAQFDYKVVDGDGGGHL
ncbi:hypothetical protein KY347_06340 [Candidatus Woesearchaeota archaeon]|nr:hypothetical protein [Candidatus Woesearchaeota archaeon]